MKKCTKCGVEKDLGEFKKCKRSKGGRTARCKLCINIYRKNYRIKNLDKFRENAREYYKKNYQQNKDRINDRRRFRYENDDTYREKRLEDGKKWRLDNDYKHNYKSYPAVYKIENLITGKTYIGESVCYERRWATHKSQLRGGYSEIPDLQQDWDKFGEDSFSFEVIYGNDQVTKEDVYQRETEIIQSLTREGVDLYNFEKKKT